MEVGLEGKLYVDGGECEEDTGTISIIGEGGLPSFLNPFPRRMEAAILDNFPLEVVLCLVLSAAPCGLISPLVGIES